MDGLIEEMLSSEFFIKSAGFTKSWLKSDAARRLVLQAMMLLDEKYIPDFNIKDFSRQSIREYEERIHRHYSDKQENILRSALEYLAAAFPEREKRLKEKWIPALLYLADEAQDNGIAPEHFRKWIIFLV